jgi:hypothetical protein
MHKKPWVGWVGRPEGSAGGLGGADCSAVGARSGGAELDVNAHKVPTIHSVATRPGEGVANSFGVPHHGALGQHCGLGGARSCGRARRFLSTRHGRTTLVRCRRGKQLRKGNAHKGGRARLRAHMIQTSIGCVHVLRTVLCVHQWEQPSVERSKHWFKKRARRFPACRWPVEKHAALRKVPLTPTQPPAPIAGQRRPAHVGSQGGRSRCPPHLLSPCHWLLPPVSGKRPYVGRFSGP